LVLKINHILYVVSCSERENKHYVLKTNFSDAKTDNAEVFNSSILTLAALSSTAKSFNFG